MKAPFFAALVAALLPAAASAHDVPPVVTDAYARVTNPASGAAFLAIANPRHSDCELIGASTPAAERAELHTSMTEGEVMKMEPLTSLPLPSDGTLILQRGGNHVMLLGLTSPLKDGDKLTLTLDFGACGKVDAELPVDNARAEEPAVKPAGLLDKLRHGGTGATH